MHIDVTGRRGLATLSGISRVSTSAPTMLIMMVTDSGSEQALELSCWYLPSMTIRKRREKLDQEAKTAIQ